MIPFVTRLKTNLDGVLSSTELLDGIMVGGDSAANKFIVDLYSGREEILLDAGSAIKGFFTRSDGETVEADGSVDENGKAYVVVPEEAYLSEGMLSIAIRLNEDPVYDEQTGEIKDWNKKIVIGSAQCLVHPIKTPNLIEG